MEISINTHVYGDVISKMAQSACQMPIVQNSSKRCRMVYISTEIDLTFLLRRFCHLV